jgi:hypothetical protein
MQLKNIARTLVCVFLALAAHSAFAGATGNQCNGKQASRVSMLQKASEYSHPDPCSELSAVK